VEPGNADGDPLSEHTSQRDALSAMLWAGRDALPVLKDDGQPAGRVRRDVLLQRATGTP